MREEPEIVSPPPPARDPAREPARPTTSEPAREPASEPAGLLGAALVVGLAAAALALALFVWLGREVLAGDTQAADEHLRGLIHGLASPGRTAFMRAVTTWAGPGRLGLLVLVLAGAFALRGWARGAVLVVVTVLGANLLDVLLKALYGRVRPSPFFDYPLPRSPSFPSGHALFAVCCFGGLAALLARRLRSRAARGAVWAAALVLILLVGLSRVYLGVHYPSDVLAGYAVGLVWVTAVAFGDRLAERRRTGRAARRAERVR